MYAGHIILGIFAAFVVIGIQGGLSLGLIPAGLSLFMQVIMYAFEVFVAGIQAYVFAILTAVYIGSSRPRGGALGIGIVAGRTPA